MSDKLYLNSVKLDGDSLPSWADIPEEIWEKILSDFLFKISDSFGFIDVLETKDLFPRGLDYFKDWELEETSLIEINNNITGRFKLNQICMEKLLEFEFSVHEKGMIPPIDHRDFDEEHYYYEFDELYFFSGNRLVGVHINHENMIEFTNLTEIEAALLNQLGSNITKDIIEKDDFVKAIRTNSTH